MAARFPCRRQDHPDYRLHLLLLQQCYQTVSCQRSVLGVGCQQVVDSRPCSIQFWCKSASFPPWSSESRSWILSAENPNATVPVSPVSSRVKHFKGLCVGVTRDIVSLLQALLRTLSRLLIWTSSQDTLHSWAASSLSSFNFLFNSVCWKVKVVSLASEITYEHAIRSYFMSEAFIWNQEWVNTTELYPTQL